MTTEKKDKTWKPDGNGVVREKTLEVQRYARTSTDLLLRYTLQRRGLAFDIADLMAYEEHQKIVDGLLTEYLRPAPLGYADITIEQLSRTDREIFKRLQSKCRGGIRRGTDGSRPLEVHLDSVLADPRVRMLLMPLQAKHSSQGESEQGGRQRSRSRSRKGKSRNERKREAQKRKTDENEEIKKELARLKGQQRQQGQQQQSRADNKGGGKGKGDKQGPRMPAELVGMDFRVQSGVHEGKPICFGYNMRAGCRSAGSGESCPKGAHVCCVPGCYKNHPCHQH